MRDVRDIRDDLNEDFVVADMSGVGGFSSPTPMPSSESSRDVRDELGGTEEQVMVMLGALKAGLSIGLVYIIGFAIAIAVMLAIWT
ncbi:MAG: hypothetical protein E7Z98_07190 [Olsenella sp.]|nr:hypothetical protein [Olsenella sp.]